MEWIQLWLSCLQHPHTVMFTTPVTILIPKNRIRLQPPMDRIQRKKYCYGQKIVHVDIQLFITLIKFQGTDMVMASSSKILKFYVFLLKCFTGAFILILL